MNTFKLTDRIAREAPVPAKGNRVLWDSSEAGLGIRVTANGARAWVLNYRAAGVQRRMTLGSTGTINATRARLLAREMKAQIIVNRVDPLRQRQDERREGTVASLAKEFDEEHVARKRPSSQVQYRHLLETVILPALGRMKVSEPTRADIIRMHRAVAKSGHAVKANRALAICSAMFGFAVERAYCADNPCRGVERSREQPRTTYLSKAEILRVSEVLGAWPDRMAAAAIRLLLLSGARKGEVEKLRWSDLDLETGTWTKPASVTKQGRVHTVPLAAPAVALLAALGPQEDGWVFPSSRRPGAHIGHLSHVWPKVAARAGLRGVRLHDLRHTYASVLVSGGASLPLIGRLLGHVLPGTTQRYAHIFDEVLREAAESAGQKLAPESNVRPLRK